MVGARCDVERSSAGVAAEGGVGAGRYEVGATEDVKTDAWAPCFLGGGGGDRWMWHRYMKKINEKSLSLGFGSFPQFSTVEQHLGYPQHYPVYPTHRHGLPGKI